MSLKYVKSKMFASFFPVQSGRFRRLIPVVGTLIFILVFVIGCGGNSTNKTPEPYFPVQKEFQTIYMQSLLTGGKLAIDNAGYLRAGATKGVLIIWPYG